MKLDYSLFFFEGKSSSLYIRPQVVSPSKPATLATSLESYTHDQHLDYQLDENKMNPN